MKKCDLLLKNCREVVTPLYDTARGAEAGLFNCTSNTDISITDGFIDEIGENLSREAAEEMDASSYVALPGLIDSHTHLVYGGSREEEFILRLKGASYEEIAAAGGGIKNSVHHTRSLTEDELFELALPRMEELLAYGTTTVEIKSGYGLDTENELKMLRVIRRLRKAFPDTIVATFMGPHEIPPGETEKSYMDKVCQEMLPRVRAEELAEFADIFVEKGVFSPESGKRYFKEAQKLGFRLKIHADELHPLGGAELAARFKAVSADHLMQISHQGIQALAESDTVATLLPGTSFFLMMKDYAPARSLISAGAMVALASDYNPGSNHGFNMQFVMNLAAMKLKMTPGEIINAVTVNAAHALSLSDRGRIAPGKRADLILLDIPNYKYLFYNYGINNVAKVIKSGMVIIENTRRISHMPQL
ncbi:imidazolonepropionase [Candidatus Mcinerneyibacteriota bacterium]|nr:imidazolonepropionase [Candidatus Mcinerneyibacteriota bacterium]